MLQLRKSTPQIFISVKVFVYSNFRKWDFFFKCWHLSPCRKKLSNFSHSSNWKSASNYVAKRYMEEVDRDVYFEDVRLQMEAKLWGEEYNRHRPPKQVEEKHSRWCVWEKSTLNECFLEMLLHEIYIYIFKYKSQAKGKQSCQYISYYGPNLNRLMPIDGNMHQPQINLRST